MSELRLQQLRLCFIALILFAALSMPAFSQLQQSPHPDLTGTWKLNISESTFYRPQNSIPMQATYQIKQSGDSIRISSDRNKLLVKNDEYKINGKEVSSYFMGTAEYKRMLPLCTRAYWDSNTLVIEQDLDYGEPLGKQHFTYRYSISADGQKLTIYFYSYMLTARSLPDLWEILTLEKQ